MLRTVSCRLAFPPSCGSQRENGTPRFRGHAPANGSSSARTQAFNGDWEVRRSEAAEEADDVGGVADGPHEPGHADEEPGDHDEGGFLGDAQAEVGLEAALD